VIRWGVSTDFSNGDRYAEALRQLEKALEPSVLRTSVVWSRMIREYRPDAKCAEEKLAGIENLRGTLDPVTAEVVSLCLASRLFFFQQWEPALAVLERFQERNGLIESLRLECRSQLEYAAKRKNKPK